MGGGGTPILEGGRELFYAHLDLIDPLFLQKKIGLSLSHLVPKKMCPKVGVMFHQNLLFDHFVPIFSLILDLVGLPFYCS